MKSHKSRGRKRKGNTKRSAIRKPRELTLRQKEEQLKCFAALNRVRRGEAKTVSEAARAEGTTLRAIRALVPNAITKDRSSNRIRVKPTDRYTVNVQILTSEGAVTATARGSGQRTLAGQHRATVKRVLRRLEPASALDQYRGKKVGGHQLVSDYSQLSLLANAGVIGQLDTLYVSPDVAA
jgi:hypothetical protein